MQIAAMEATAAAAVEEDLEEVHKHFLEELVAKLKMEAQVIDWVVAEEEELPLQDKMDLPQEQTEEALEEMVHLHILHGERSIGDLS